MSGNPFIGMQYVWRGFQNLTTPGLRRYVALPLLLNVLVMGGASIWGIGKLDGWIGELIDMLPGFLSFLYWILMPLAVIVVVFSLFYFFSAVLMIIAGPLNGLLAERVETMQGYTIPEESIPSMTVRTVGRELRKVAYYLPRYLGIFILGLIPLLQVIAAPLWLWFGGWMMAVQYVDFSFDNHTKPFKDVRDAMSQDLFTVMGFGLLVALLLTIPVINLFIMPAAVIGATLMRIERMPFHGQSQNISYAEGITADERPGLTHDETQGSGRG